MQLLQVMMEAGVEGWGPHPSCLIFLGRIPWDRDALHCGPVNLNALQRLTVALSQSSLRQVSALQRLSHSREIAIVRFVALFFNHCGDGRNVFVSLLEVE